MLTKTPNINDLFKGEITSNEVIDNIFNSLENQLLDRKEISLGLGEVTFISVYFLERLEKVVTGAKELNVKIQITNVQPSVYKVFQVARVKSILEICG